MSNNYINTIAQTLELKITENGNRDDMAVDNDRTVNGADYIITDG